MASREELTEKKEFTTETRRAQREKTMRNIVILITCIGMIAVLSISTRSQTKAQKVEVNKLIGTYSAKTINALNKNRERFKYKSENKNIFWADINDDGEFDAIVEIFGNLHANLLQHAR